MGFGFSLPLRSVLVLAKENREESRIICGVAADPLDKMESAELVLLKIDFLEAAWVTAIPDS